MSSIDYIKMILPAFISNIPLLHYSIIPCCILVKMATKNCNSKKKEVSIHLKGSNADTTLVGKIGSRIFP